MDEIVEKLLSIQSNLGMEPSYRGNFADCGAYGAHQLLDDIEGHLQYRGFFNSKIPYKDNWFKYWSEETPTKVYKYELPFNPQPFESFGVNTTDIWPVQYNGEDPFLYFVNKDFVEVYKYSTTRDTETHAFVELGQPPVDRLGHTIRGLYVRSTEPTNMSQKDVNEEDMRYIDQIIEKYKDITWRENEFLQISYDFDLKNNEFIKFEHKRKEYYLSKYAYKFYYIKETPDKKFSRNNPSLISQMKDTLKKYTPFRGSSA